MIESKPSKVKHSDTISLQRGHQMFHQLIRTQFLYDWHHGNKIKKYRQDKYIQKEMLKWKDWEPCNRVEISLDWEYWANTELVPDRPPNFLNRTDLVIAGSCRPRVKTKSNQNKQDHRIKRFWGRKKGKPIEQRQRRRPGEEQGPEIGGRGGGGIERWSRSWSRGSPWPTPDEAPAPGSFPRTIIENSESN